jgi:hypothetical protein
MPPKTSRVTQGVVERWTGWGKGLEGEAERERLLIGAERAIVFVFRAR